VTVPRDEPEPCPHQHPIYRTPGHQFQPSACVKERGHDTHWNGRGDVWRTDDEQWVAMETKLAAINAAIIDAGITYPTGAAAIRDLAAMAAGRLEDLQTAEALVAAMRPVVEAAEAWVDAPFGIDMASRTHALVKAVRSTRGGGPDGG